MQPVQDLNIGDTLSATQYQLVLQDTTPTSWPTGPSAAGETAGCRNWRT